MSVPPEVIDAIRRWMEKAEHDVEAARRIMARTEDCPYDTVCFHCQQAVEKYLKALLTFHGIQAPRTHNLVTLYGLLPSDARLPVPFDEFKALTPYAIEARYPDDWPAPRPEEAERAFATVEAVREYVRAALPPATLS